MINTAIMLCRYMKTRYSDKQHGGYNIYEDDKIIISLDTCVPNLDIWIKLPSGEKYMVLCQPYTGYKQIYHPGKWEEYIISLKEKALNAKTKYDIEEKEKAEISHNLRYGKLPEELNLIFKKEATK